MTGRRLALELNRRGLGGLEGRNDIFELNAAAKIRFAGVTPGTREAEHLALSIRVGFDLHTCTWECSVSASKVIHRAITAGLLERIVSGASAVTDELGAPLNVRAA